MNLRELSRYRQWLDDRGRAEALIDWDDVQGMGVGTVGAVASARVRVHHPEIPRDAQVLLYGYDTERNTFMVAHEGERIWVLTAGRVWVEDVFHAHMLCPNKRAYPDRTDARFAYLMANRGSEIPFTKHPDEPSSATG